MAEATDRLHKAPDRTKPITPREILTHARYLARNEVRQQIKERGLKVHEFSQKQLTEQADELIRAKPELIGIAKIAVEGIRDRSKLSSAAQKPKPSNQTTIPVQNSGSKWSWFKWWLR